MSFAIPSKSESVHVSNDHQSLSGDLNHVHWSEDDIATVIAALQSGEASPEVRAQSDVLSVDTEVPLPMSNEHEPLSCDSDVVQLSEQLSAEEIANLVAAIEDFEASYEPRAEPNSFHNDTEDSLRNINDTLLAGPADAHVDRSQNCTTSTKRKSCHTTKFGNTSSIPKKKPKCRSLKGNDNTQGKFGPYTLADVQATVMVMPVDDPNPVDISSRKILDPSGESLRTRRYGVMELDDCSYVAGNGYVAKNLPPGLTRVRLCEWDDNPCGLFIEMDQYHIDQHMLYWHGVDARTNLKAIPCQYADCSAAAQKIQYLGRHIETVHFDTCWQCPYCMIVRSRIDVVRQHMKDKCKTLIALRNQAQNGGNDVHSRELIPLFKGYIVPTTSAT
ncbi:hypothetical protein CY34DRAFT_18176 [Suillus luteus UH-Slu-Lm8-n1]|uniref:Uncharacterized protein n=1 Tax=Suillus luteus UH-Slu-Lm8-n1 TaxID=930992 RepID=A0A0D0AHH8_9AGAM|nr:hypothetical protein CY34DRAFT_18176 [Suillus luteus UH-Slu-Lm8-n1]